MINDNEHNDDIQKTDRRSFLDQAGRFAVVTPPVVALMLATDSSKKALAASGALGTTSTVTTTSTTTVTVSATLSTITLNFQMHEKPVDDSRLAMKVGSMGVMKG